MVVESSNPVETLYRNQVSYLERPRLSNVKYEYDILTVEDPGNIVVKIKDSQTDSDEEKLGKKLKAYCKEDISQKKAQFPREMVYAGMPVLVFKSDDGSVCRAEIIKVDGDIANLYLVDLGVDLKTSLDNLLPVTVSFMRIPKIGLRCRLPQILPNTDTGDVWDSRVKDKKCYMGKKQTIALNDYFPGSKVYDAVLEVDEMNVAVKFLHMGVVKPQPLPQTKEDGAVFPTFDYSPWLGLKIVVYAMRAYLDEPSGKLKVVLQPNPDYSAEVQSEIFEYVKNNPNNDPVNVFPGVACLAKYGEDDYYRAVILKAVDQNLVEIEYVDYKEAAVVPVSYLKIIPSSLLEKPEAAVVCQLTELLKSNFKDLAKLQELTTDQDLYAVIDAVEPAVFGRDLLLSLYFPKDFASGADKPFSALLGTLNQPEEITDVLQPLIVGTQEVGRLFLKPGYPDASKFYPGSTPQVSFIADWESIWLQNTEDIDVAEQISEELKQFYRNEGCDDDSRVEFIRNLRKGDYVAVEYKDEHVEELIWYRGKVIEIDSKEPPKVSILFFDYGFDDWVNLEALYPLHMYFFKDTPKAFQVAIK